MKKSFGLIFILLSLFFCSCSPYDPTPYIPREYGDAFLCDGSFTLGGQIEASAEKESGPAPQILSAAYRIRQENAFYSIRYREGETVSVEPASVSLSSPVTAPSELRLGELQSFFKAVWSLSQTTGSKDLPSQREESIRVSFSSAEALFDHLPAQGLPCYVYSLSEDTLFPLSGAYAGSRSLGTCTVASSGSGTLFYILIDL